MIFPAEITLTMNLEILLGLTALILFSLGEANTPDPHPALLHGSVRMSFSPSQKMGTIRTISWKFEKNGKRSTILDNSEKPYYIYPSQFRDRLLISDDFYTMTIMDLTMEDGGIYTVDVAHTNGRTEYYSFTVTVYEPTPKPTIRTEIKENTTERCNVTLHCSVPSNTSYLSYIWKSRHQDSTYQLYSNGSTIQISLPPDRQDMEFLCIVQNPADQKNVSISIKYCTGSESRSSPPSPFRSHLIISVSIALLILTITVAVISIRIKHKRTKGKANKLEPLSIAVPDKETKEIRNAEIDYIEVTTQRREDNQRIEMENDHYIGMPSPQKIKAETLYTTLQHPQPKYT